MYFVIVVAPGDSVELKLGLSAADMVAPWWMREEEIKCEQLGWPLHMTHM